MTNGESSYRRFLAGDDTAFREIVDCYYDMLVLYINTYAKNLDVAENLAQETLVKLAIKKPKFKGDSTFKTWLYSIARNLSLDYLKATSKNKSIQIENAIDLVAEQQVEEDILIEERKIIINNAIKELKTEYRQVIWLKYFEDMSAKEIAGVMKKSLNSVEHLLSRARDCLREKLKEEDIII